ncbi:hypothetical protein N2152v2_011083 [Parachlorella kessleri]
MKEVGRPDEVRRNEEATQRHHFSEKERFNSERFDNPESADSRFGQAFAEGGDTEPGRAVTEESAKAAHAQSMGINFIPEKLAHAKADPSVPEAPPNTPGAKPGEVEPDNRAGEMGPGMGSTRAAWDSRRDAGSPEGGLHLAVRGGPDGAQQGSGRPEDAGSEGEPREIIEELHKGDEWAS